MFIKDSVKLLFLGREEILENSFLVFENSFFEVLFFILR